MEHIANILPLLWNIIEKNNKCAVNVTTKENEIIVSIWSNRRWNRFKNRNIDLLISEIGAHYV